MTSPCLLEPIKVDEVMKNLVGVDSQMATGLDGQKLVDLKSIPVEELTLLFNKWVYMGTLPLVICVTM